MIPQSTRWWDDNSTDWQPATFYVFVADNDSILSRVFYSPTDAQVNCLKNIKTDIITAPTCFGAVTPSSGSALFVLAKVTVVKIVN